MQIKKSTDPICNPTTQINIVTEISDETLKAIIESVKLSI